MTKKLTDLESRLDAAYARVDSAVKIKQQRNIYRKAIHAIIACDADDVIEYIKTVDLLACEADAKAEAL